MHQFTDSGRKSAILPQLYSIAAGGGRLFGSRFTNRMAARPPFRLKIKGR